MASINSLLPLLGFLVATLIAGVSVFIYYKKGGNQASAEVISTYREQVTQLKDQLSSITTTLQLKIDDLTREVGRLSGVIQGKDERMKTLEDLVTARNPEMIAIFKKMNDALVEIRGFMEKLNHKTAKSTDILVGQEERRLEHTKK